MKKSVKILIIVLCLIIIVLVTFIIVEKIANKNIRSNSMPKDNMTDVEKNDKTKNNEKSNDSNGIEQYKITSDIINSNEHYMVISAYNQKQNLVWSYTSDKVSVPQYENLSYIGDTYSCTSNKKLVYIAVNGSIIALDYQSGKVVWKNDDYTVSCGPVCIDKNGTIYASCAELLEIIIINNDGKTVKKLNGIEEGFSIGSGEGFWMNDISLENDEKTLNLSYGEMNEDGSEHEYVTKINLDNYKIDKTEIN